MSSSEENSLTKKILVVLGMLALLGLALFFIIDYYVEIYKKQTDVCSCVNLANELIGLFWGLLTAAFILLLLGIYAISKKLSSSFFFKLMGLCIFAAIIVYIISRRIAKCNTGCNITAITSPALLILGWVLLAIWLVITFYILSKTKLFEDAEKEIRKIPSEDELCQKILNEAKNFKDHKQMSNEEIGAEVKRLLDTLPDF